MLRGNVLFVLVSLACVVVGLPVQSGRRDVRSPVDTRSLMLRGYVRGQPVAGYLMDPQAMMTAYSSGNVVGAGAYQRSSLKPACRNCDQEYPAEEQAPKWTPSETPVVESPPDTQNGEEEPEEPEKDVRQPKAPKAPKGPKRPTPVEEDDEEDEEPRFQGAPHFSRFFPMSFNYPGSNGRSGEEGGLSPGVATAISNSFSQGKGAIASSQATAYGGSDPNQSRKSAQNRRRY